MDRDSAFRRVGAVRLVATGVLAAEAAFGAPAPRLVCPAPIHDFGRVDSSALVRHVFTLFNEGDAPLAIERIRACCGATAEASSLTLAPGGRSDLTVALSLLGRSGEQHKSIFVVSNDPAQPYYRLQLVGRAVSALTATPDRVDFGMLDEKATAESSVLLASEGNESFRVTGVRSSAGWFRAEAADAGSGIRREIRVRTVAPLPGGYVQGVVTVLTDLARCPQLQFSVAAAVDSDVVVLPRELVWRAAASNEPPVRYLAIRRRSGAAFRILAVEPPEPSVSVTVSALGARGYRLAVAPASGLPRLEGRFLTIHSDIPGTGEIEIPCRVVQAGGGAP